MTGAVSSVFKFRIVSLLRRFTRSENMPPHNQNQICVVETVIDGMHLKEPKGEFEENEDVKRTSFEDALEIVGTC